MNDLKAFELLKQGDKQSLEWIYRTYRDAVAGWIMKQYNYTPEDAKATFTDALIILERKAFTDVNAQLTSNLTTFLIGIVKNLLQTEERRKKRYTPLDDFFKELGSDENPFETDNTDAIIARMMTAVQNMGNPCSTIIIQFYFERKHDSETKLLLNYENEKGVKSQRWRCLEQLRKILKISKTK